MSPTVPPAAEIAAAKAGTARTRAVWNRMDEEARRRVGRDLRLLYANVVAQPLPEPLTRIVDDLAKALAGTEGSS